MQPPDATYWTVALVYAVWTPLDAEVIPLGRGWEGGGVRNRWQNRGQKRNIGHGEGSIKVGGGSGLVLYVFEN